MPGERPVEAPFFQVGVLVQDLDAARDELSRALGITWTEPIEREHRGFRLRVCFSREGPPYLELVEGPPGSPWDATEGSRIDHIAYWTPDINEGKQALDAEGVELEFDGTAIGGTFTYHRGVQSGLRIELIDGRERAARYESWNLENPDA